jgi:hypothetical protein
MSNTLFACVYQRLSASHSAVFFSHNKSASVSQKPCNEQGESRTYDLHRERRYSLLPLYGLFFLKNHTYWHTPFFWKKTHTYVQICMPKIHHPYGYTAIRTMYVVPGTRGCFQSRPIKNQATYSFLQHLAMYLRTREDDVGLWSCRSKRGRSDRFRLPISCVSATYSRLVVRSPNSLIKR